MAEEKSKQECLEEEKQIILNCDHDFGVPNDVSNFEFTKENLFCKKCGQHFITIVKACREEFFNPSNSYLSPKCQNCGFQTTIDQFCSEAWLQLTVDEKSIWVCPDCIAKKANAS